MTPPARDRLLWKRRVDSFLWRDPSMAVVRLRSVLRTYVEEFDRVYIIGGMLRDLARGGKAAFRSDVDLVVWADPQKVSSFAVKSGAEANKYGGFRSIHPHWEVDFWALDNTWASVAGHVHVAEPRDLLKSTFFDCDAALYDLKSRNIIASECYLSNLASRTVDLNLAATPSVNSNLMRASRRLLLWNATAGPRLRAFIESELNEKSFGKILSLEAERYPSPVIGLFENRERLKRALLHKESRVSFGAEFAEQLNLPGITPNPRPSSAPR